MMELFIPDILRVTPSAPISAGGNKVLGETDLSIPAGAEFRKVFFEELTRRCYIENGGFDTLQNIARVHHEEYFGVGLSKIKRWKVFFSKYNILVNIEERAGAIFVKAA